MYSRRRYTIEILDSQKAIIARQNSEVSTRDAKFVSHRMHLQPKKQNVPCFKYQICRKGVAISKITLFWRYRSDVNCLTTIFTTSFEAIVFLWPVPFPSTSEGVPNSRSFHYSWVWVDMFAEVVVYAGNCYDHWTTGYVHRIITGLESNSNSTCTTLQVFFKWLWNTVIRDPDLEHPVSDFPSHWILFIFCG